MDNDQHLNLIMTAKTKLANYVQDFKKWRKENYSDEEIDGNLTDDVSYPGWEELDDFFEQLLETGLISEIDQEDQTNLIYLIARGYDREAFLGELRETRPISTRGDLSDQDFIKLAATASTLTGSEYDDAKASVAICFRKLEYLTPEVESILLKLYSDSNEYTKRMALVALAKLGYKDTLTLVDKSWTIDHEWHKLACLLVLDKYFTGRSLLLLFLSEPVRDNMPYLAEEAQKLKRKNNL